MEIVQVAGLYPPHLGGEELVVQRLAGIQAATHRVTVYTSDIGVGAAAGRQRCGRLQVVRDRGWPVGNTPVVPCCWSACSGTGPHRTSCTCTPGSR